MKKQLFPAVLENLDPVIAFVHEELDTTDCSMRSSMQLDVAVEELFVNVARYAYGAGSGDIEIACGVDEQTQQFVVVLKDAGIPFDPIAKPDADTTLSAEERPIGGLGILMVKKSMDSFTYKYVDGHNVTEIRKNL